MPFDADAHTKLCDLVRGIVADDLVSGIGDVSDGGLAAVLGEAVARSGLGVQATVPEGADTVPWLFGESPSRVVVCVTPEQLKVVHQRHLDSGVPARFLGTVEGDRLRIAPQDGEPLVDLAADTVTATWRDRLPAAFGAGTTQG